MKHSRMRRLSRALKRRKTQSRYRSRKIGLLSSLWVQGALGILGVTLLALLVLATAGAYQTWSEVRQQAQVSEEKYLEAQQRYEQVSTSLHQVQTQQGLEQQLRERFNVAKEGEGVIVILDSFAGESATAGEDQQSPWWENVFFFWR